MNVDSLRSAGKEDEESAEVKIAKVAITNVMLWKVQKTNHAFIKLLINACFSRWCIWTPYAAVCSLPVLGFSNLLTPLLSTIPAMTGTW